jgi:hypothetical protein
MKLGVGWNVKRYQILSPLALYSSIVVRGGSSIVKINNQPMECFETVDGSIFHSQVRMFQTCKGLIETALQYLFKEIYYKNY